MSYLYVPASGPEDRSYHSGEKQSVGGAPVGILVLDLRYPLFPGNVANASTWKFPVIYKVLEGAANSILSGDPKIGDMVVEAGKDLVDQGVGAIVGSCGYFGHYQQQAAAALHVPVYLSSLLQAPLILRSLRPDQKLAIICAQAETLGEDILGACGIDDLSRLVIGDMHKLPEFQNLLNRTGSFNGRQLEREVTEVAKNLVRDHPEIGTFLLECSDLPPYAHTIQAAVRCPVFDYTSMVNWVFNGVIRQPFAGFM